MGADPNDMDDRPSVGISDDLPTFDRAMLLVLSHRQNDNTPLSLDQERLLDNWMAGTLSPTDADRAADLTKSNRFAAERILERRIITAANKGPGVPSGLAAQILRASQPPRTRSSGIFNLRWPTLSGWQWSGLGAAVAATAVIAAFGFQAWQARLRPDQSFQIAMVTIDDRGILFEGTRRTRGSQPQAPTQSGATRAETRFRDINIPTVLLRRAIASASTNNAAVEHSELMTYLRTQNTAIDSRARILIDSALAGSLLEKPEGDTNLQIRIYDLDDPHAAAIRNKIKMPATDGHFILLTLAQ